MVRVPCENSGSRHPDRLHLRRRDFVVLPQLAEIGVPLIQGSV